MLAVKMASVTGWNTKTYTVVLGWQSLNKKNFNDSELLLVFS